MVECVSGCCRCCWDTQMILTREDLERISREGYEVEEFAVIDSKGLYRLRNVNGHCIFLNPDSCRCRIYHARPVGCRIYPVVYLEGEGPTVDGECPASHTVTPEEFEEKSKTLTRILEELGILKCGGPERKSL